MFTDDIHRDWVGEEDGCYSQTSPVDPHVGTLLKIGIASLLTQEDHELRSVNTAFLHRVVSRTKAEEK